METGHASLPHPAADALAEVLAQHRALRTLFVRSLQVVERARAGDLTAAASLPVLLVRALRIVEEHMRQEEALVLPILEEDTPLGPLRAEAYLREHARQRRELERFAATPLVQLGSVADALAELCQDLLLDMDEEEETLLRPEILRDDVVEIDQYTG
jgi:hypothetical protein